MNIKQLKISSVVNLFNLKDLSTNKQSINFIIINILVAFLGFSRSFVFIKFLDFKGLGILTLIQAGANLVGFFQIGLINGGYRLFAVQDAKDSQNTNNIIFSYFGVLFIAVSAVFFLGSVFGIITDWAVVGISILTGLFILVNNWLTNTLIAGRVYTLLNKANLISAILSVACLPLAYYYGIYGAAFGVMLQPLAFNIIIFIASKSSWPDKFIFQISQIRNILNYGFVPYLSGLFLLLYMQIERWSIKSFLGTTALGNLYIPYLITALWVLIPTSILNLLFPPAARYFTENNLVKFGKIIKKHFIINITYNAVAIIVLMLLLSPAVRVIFPQHLPYTKYAIYILPGLVFRSLADPISVVLNSVVKLKPMFWSDLTGITLYIVMLSVLVIMKLFTLTHVIICFDIYLGYKFIYLFIVYLKTKKQYSF
jgi:O-antigen/teichoic acid export membrane protein